MESLRDRLKDHWAAAGTKVRPGVDDGGVAAFERGHGVRLSGELGRYFRAVDGMNEDESDPNMFEFFPLHRLQDVETLGLHAEVPELAWSLPDPRGWYIFCQYMIWSHAYAVCLGTAQADTSPVIWMTRDAHGEIAASFSEFLARYLDNYMAVVP